MTKHEMLQELEWQKTHIEKEFQILCDKHEVTPEKAKVYGGETQRLDIAIYAISHHLWREHHDDN